MDIRQLKLTQDGFRLKRDELLKMAEFVKGGGIFDKASLAAHNPDRTSLIAINRFEDGDLYVRDGMHRLAAIHLGGRQELMPEEFFIEEYSYALYLEVNLAENWVTPFDPRIHVRVPEFFGFKNLIHIFKHRGDSDEQLLQEIAEGTEMYRTDRRPVHDSIIAYLDEYMSVSMT